MTSDEEQLIRSLREGGIHLQRRKYAIDIRKGNSTSVDTSRLKTLRQFQFDRMWMEKAHHLLVRLINIRIPEKEGNKKQKDREWQDLVEFFKACGYGRCDGKRWDTSESIEAVARYWRKCRSLTRDMTDLPVFEWSTLKKTHSSVLVARVMRSIPEKVDRGEIYDPLDALWIALEVSKIKGIEYRRCANPKCQRYAPVYWRGSGPGRPPLYCDARCEDRHRKARKKEGKE